MFKSKTEQAASPQPLRLWPGVVAAVLVLMGIYIGPFFLPETAIFGMIVGFLGVLAIVVWWIFFSRALWPERLSALGLMIAVLAATPHFLHESVAKGNMGLQFFLHAIPILSLAFVVWAWVSRRFSARLRRVSMITVILLACGVWTLVRSKGITSDGAPEFSWRWAETPEQQLLLQASAETFESTQHRPPVLPSAQSTAETPTKALAHQTHNEQSDSIQTKPQAAAAISTSDKPRMAQAHEAAVEILSHSAKVEPEAEWPGFRGRDRNSIVSGLRFETNWAAAPPVELWRRALGPGVSSCAVRGDLLYTQEQRGENEIVACYHLNTGEPVWAHSDSVRFWDSHVGAGPRATPALHGNRVFTLGATGILNALAARDGSVVWSRNTVPDTSIKTPLWGFVSSPLIFDDMVIIYVGALRAYDITTGNPRWIAPVGGGSYSSPQLLTIAGVAQILLQSHNGTISVAPGDGTVLWQYAWPGVGIVQPGQIAEGELLISMIDDMAIPIGVRRIAVTHTVAGWNVAERWTSTALKPSFSSFVLHKGHAFGFDGSILACINLEDGKRKWKGGRYGHGQLVLLPEQDLLLVLSEQGEIALVNAGTEQFTELARIPALKGKTWNHPVLIGDILLVRNGQEMVAYRLALAGA